MNETLTFAIPTLFGLESLAADELRRLDLPQVRAENGRVLCSVSRLFGCGIIIPQAAGIFYTDMGLFSVKFINLHLLWPLGLVPTHPRSSARVFLRPHGSGMDGRCCEIRPVPIYWF